MTTENVTFSNDPSVCGGCFGLGEHKRNCRNNPKYELRIELADKADDLGDLIGSNDPGAANMAYTLAARLRVGRSWAQ